jgi:hypothetical protein
MVYNDMYYYTTSTNTTVTNSNVYYPYPTSVAVSPTVYRASDPLWDLQRQANLEGAAIPENDMAWLKRRVSEISWVPA